MENSRLPNCKIDGFIYLLMLQTKTNTVCSHTVGRPRDAVALMSSVARDLNTNVAWNTNCEPAKKLSGHVKNNLSVE